MSETDKKEILKAITELNTGFVGLNARFDELNTGFVGLNARFDDFEGRFVELTKEVRAGFGKLDTRLSSVEEELAALSKVVDSLIEGDTLGVRHITLTREEYDKFVELTSLPNRFAH